MALAPPPLNQLVPSAEDQCDCVHPEAVMDARLLLRDSSDTEAVASLFAVLGDPTRIQVLTVLMAGELCVGDISVATGVNRSTVSHQLRVLRDHRLVRRRREGKVMYYALDDEHITDLLSVAGSHVAEALGVQPVREVSA